MDYIVSGLPLAPFQPLFGLDESELSVRGIARMTADTKPGYPCRITLEDAEPGETLLLLNWRHLDTDSPYRSDGPIFLRESAAQTADVRNATPNNDARGCCRCVPTMPTAGCAMPTSSKASLSNR